MHQNKDRGDRNTGNADYLKYDGTNQEPGIASIVLTEVPQIVNLKARHLLIPVWIVPMVLDLLFQIRFVWVAVTEPGRLKRTPGMTGGS